MKRRMKTLFVVILVFISCIIVAAGGYVAYMSIQYYRIGNIDLDIQTNQTNSVALDTEYRVLTYNVGFGAYTPDFSFFMDSGEMLDGTKVHGSQSVAASKEVVLANTQGIHTIINNGNYDFLAMQEVDVNSTRSKGVNMANSLTLPNYSSTFAYNFHSPFLMYPLSSPHGSVNSGLLTLSHFSLADSMRKELPITTAFFGKFFDLDRCFSVNYHTLSNGKKFAFVNIHFTAYDEGGVIRAQQLQVLNTFLAQERSQGNYVVVAGDFNHDIADSLHLFTTQQKVPSWVSVLNSSDLTAGYNIASSTNVATCRSTDMAYQENVNYTVVIDGFLVSNNIEIVDVNNIDTGFAYSDHNPVEMTFKLVS